MQITTQPDDNDDIINLEVLADHDSPVNKIRFHTKPTHKRNKSLLDSLKDTFKMSVPHPFSKPNSRSSSQQFVYHSRKESRAETVDQDYMAIPSERDKEEGYDTNRIMTTEMSERKRINPFRHEYRDTGEGEEDEKEEDIDEGEEEDKIELVDMQDIPSRGAESPFSQLQASGLFNNSMHGNSEANEVIKSATSSELENKDKVLRTTTTASEKWKSARFALNAVTFNKGAEEAIERKHALIMRGHTVEKLFRKRDIKFYIDPHGLFKKIWNLILSFTLFYYSLIAPVRWSQRLHGSAWVTIDGILDALTWLDMIFFFFTATIEPTRTIKENKQIAINYLKTFFILDLVAALPFYMINEDTYILKVLRVIHLPRVYRVLFKLLIGYPRWQRVLNFIKTFYLFCATLNFLAGIWIFPGEVARGAESWMGSNFESQDTFSDIWNLWLMGAGFVVTTITTVGFGDLLPQNSSEQGIVMMFQFLGVVLTGLLQGQLTYVMKSDYKKQIQEVNLELEAWVLKLENSRKAFRAEKDQNFYTDTIPPTKEMHNVFKFFNSQNLNPLTWKSEFYPELNPSAQNEVTFLIFSSVIQRFSVFFRFFTDDTFLKEIVTTLIPKILSPREVIFRRGGHAKGLYFIIKGYAMLSYKETSLVTLKEGSFFGESSLLERKCMVDYIAGHEELQCLYLPRKQLLEICDRYPEQKCLFQRIIYERTDHYKKIISKMFVATQVRFDEFTPFHARISSQGENGARNNTRILRKAFMKEYINTSLSDQNQSKDAKNVKDIVLNLPSPGSPQPFVFSQEEKSIMSNTNLESCNYMSRTASFTHNNVIPSFQPSPTLFQPSPTLLQHSPLSLLKPQSCQVTKPRDSVIPSIVVLSPRGQVQNSGFFSGKLDTIIQHQPGQVPSMTLLTEDQISDPDQEVDENQEVASTVSESDQGGDDDDSDSDASDLNNSLEVPLETIQPDFQDLNHYDKILQYIDEQISKFDFQIKRVDLSSREKILQEWKNMRAILKRAQIDVHEDGNNG